MATSRKRMIDPEFFFDEELSGISERARLLYIGLWGLSCDINFTLPNKPQWIKAQVFPYTNLDIAIPLQELEKIKKLVPFIAEDEKPYYHVPNMKKYQKIDHPTLKYPAFIANSANPTRIVPEGSKSTRSQSNVIQSNSIQDKLLRKEQAREFNQSLFQGLKDGGIEIQDAAGERTKYPSLFRRKNPDVNYWIGVAKYSQSFNFKPGEGKDYIFPWKGPVKLSKLYYEVRQKFDEQNQVRDGTQRLSQMKSELFKSNLTPKTK